MKKELKTLSDERKEDGYWSYIFMEKHVKFHLKNLQKDLKNEIKERKWVWNEEKFGNVRAHKMFNEYTYELIDLINELFKKHLGGDFA